MHHNAPNRPLWLSEFVAVWGYVQRNYFLTKRYLMWEIVWLVYVTVNAMAITFIGAGVDAVGGTVDTRFLMTYLLVGALLWNYLSMLFDVLSETVSWERWEGTIEYTFMSPSSRVTHLLGMGLYAVLYGILQTVVTLVVCYLFFGDMLDLSNANYWGALLILAICSISLVGFGIVAAVLPLLSPEKGQQVSYIVSSVLLLVSGVYYEVDVLPGWMQAIATVSPVTYALQGARAALQDGAGIVELWGSIWPLLIMGAVFVPLGIFIFHLGESYAKRTGKLKRSG
jgi:ABC-2 type transport system permease protein